MKHHLFLQQLFNQPHMVLPDLLTMAVAWASTRMGMQLNQVNVTVPMAWKDDGPDVAAVSPQDQRLAAAQQTGVLVIPVYGVLVPREANVGLCANQTSYESLRAQLQAGLADPRVEAIVMEFDSPGGAVTGCFELAAEIRAARDIKPIHAIAHYSAFSAAYALASACTDISLSESSGVGSIGVIMKHADFSQQLADDGIKVTTFYRGARKNDLAPDAALSDDTIAVVDARIDRYYNQFVESVAANRGLKVEDVRATEAGVFFGIDAVTAGLADRIEPQQQAINRIAADVAASRATPPTPRKRAQAAAVAMQMASQL